MEMAVKITDKVDKIDGEMLVDDGSALLFHLTC